MADHIELGSKEFWERIRQDPASIAVEVCSIDLVNLDKTLQHHPALRAWVNAAFEVSKIAVEKAKWQLTKARALRLLAGKAMPDEHTGKAKTVGVLEAEVDAAPDVEEATQLLFSQQEVNGALRAIAEALEDRKDMLIQLSAKLRQVERDYR